MYILQENLFSFEELMDLEPKQKYPALCRFRSDSLCEGIEEVFTPRTEATGY